ncbi:MAG: IreB family regulatory phosphoprotein [Oscillospiraceae bacterium]|nr:IreB family regulatory phosphoprotein [Oscillospiraceae bacterium]
MYDKTMTFSVNDEKEIEMKRNLTIVYDALVQKGYNPVNQIVGYILSEDPTYITTYNNARSIIRHIDRDELLQVLVKAYISE